MCAVYPNYNQGKGSSLETFKRFQEFVIWSGTLEMHDIFSLFLICHKFEFTLGVCKHCHPLSGEEIWVKVEFMGVVA